MELATEAEIMTIAEDYSTVTTIDPPPEGVPLEQAQKTHSLYRIEKEIDKVSITLVRNRPQVLKVMEDATTMGIRTFIGLFQQLGDMQPDLTNTADG